MNNIFSSVRNLILSINTLLFLLSIIAYYLPSDSWSFIAPFSFLFIPLFISQTILLLIFSENTRPFKLTSLILFLFSIPLIFNIIGFHIPWWDKHEGIKVVSWNVKNFDIYNWSNNNNTRKDIVEELKNQEGDIICIQEFFTNKGDWDMIKKIKDIGYPYYYFKELYTNSNGNQWGLAIFSKFPIGQTKKLDFKDYGAKLNQCIAAKIKTPIGEIEVYNAHFQSIHFGYEDYRFIDNVKENKDSLEAKEAIQIYNKLRKAYKNRIPQVKIVKDELKGNLDGKYIVCCDLNDIPNSNAYKQLSENLNDAFVKKGFGLSATTEVPIPFYRIDYIFTSKNLKTVLYKRVCNKFSDHNLISARIL